MRYLEIKNKITNNYKVLSKNQRKIANFYIENFDRVPFLSVQDVSKATGASVASVVRFTQRIGFSGFSEMRDQIARDLQNHLESNALFPLIRNLEDDTLTSVANIDIENINETLKNVERENFQGAVELINDARWVYTAGLGISFLLAEIMAYQLNQIGVLASAFRQGTASFLEQVLFLEKSDLLVAFSFPPYSRETVNLAQYASEKRIPVLAVTNRDASPISFFSTVSLAVKSENMLFTNSFAAISVLINALSTECALRNRPRAEAMLKSMNRLNDKSDEYL